MNRKDRRRFNPAVFVFVYSSQFEGVHLYEADVIPSLIALSGYSTQRITNVCMTIKYCFSTFQSLCSQAKKRRLLTGKKIIPEMPAGIPPPLC